MSYRSSLFLVGVHGRRGSGEETARESARDPNKPAVSFIVVLVLADLAIVCTCCGGIRSYCKPCCCYSKKTKKDVGEGDDVDDFDEDKPNASAV